MELVNVSGLTAAWIGGYLRHPRHSLTFVVKATFQLQHGGVATLAEKQQPPTGMLYENDDPNGAQRYDNDFAQLKPKSDVLVVGHCHTPGGKPMTVCEVRIRVAGVDRRLAVIGDRYWINRGVTGKVGLLQDVAQRVVDGLTPSRMSDPRPFTSMPLSWDRAFGGPRFAENPVGRGMEPIPYDSGRMLTLLPNVELPEKLIGAFSHHPEPAGFGPVSIAAPSRARKLGSYGGSYLKKRWPWFAEDMDWTYFNAAHKSQQLDRFLRSDESIELTHMHPNHPVFSCKLPGVRPRLFTLELDAQKREVWTEIALVCDTLWVDADTETACLVWRGNRDVSSAKHPELQCCFVDREPLDKPAAPAPEFRARLAAELKEREARKKIFLPEPVPVALPAAAAPPVAAAAAPGPDAEADQAEQQAAQAEARLDALAAERGAKAQPMTQSALDAQARQQFDLLAGARQRLLDLGKAVPKGLETLLAAGPLVPVAAELADQPPPAPPAEAQTPATAPAAAPGMTRADVIRTLATSRVLDKQDLTGVNLEGLDLGGVSLRETILAHAFLKGARLDGANLRGAVLHDADLQGADLQGADLSGADLTEAVLLRANLNKARLDGADLTRAQIEATRAIGCRAVKTLFQRAVILDSDFEEAQLAEASFADARIERTTFERADLGKAVFDRVRGVRLVFGMTSLQGASARDAWFTQCNFERAEAAGAVFERARLERCALLYARFNGAELSGLQAAHCFLRGVNFRNARLVEADLSHTDCAFGNFFQANLEGARIVEADFRHANLFDAECWHVNNFKTLMDGANLKRNKIGLGVHVNP